MLKKTFLWTLAVVITVAAAIYQRRTGPTYEKRLTLEIGGETYDIELLRSHETGSECRFVIEMPDEEVTAEVFYKRFPTGDEWSSAPLIRNNTSMIVLLPGQPPAGKLAYYLEFTRAGQKYALSKDEPVIIRFKGAVPAWALILHVLVIFAAMLISSISGLFALSGIRHFRFYTSLTLILLLIGGLILGPVVQKYAFGEWWTGVPFGWDLTDNKTLVAILAFLVAWWGNRKRERPVLSIAAAVLVLIVFSIPHSLFGSEFNYETGEIIQNMIHPLVFVF